MATEAGKTGATSTGKGPWIEGVHKNQLDAGSEAPSGWDGPEAPDGKRVKADGHKGGNYESSNSGDKVGMG